tara:strand:+ start:196 stop:510 length:315 start_codon:yes stop_codon:yes gene_type:complete
MSAVSIFLISSCVILSILLSISVYFNIKHGILILNIMDKIDISLDIIDQKYASVSEILEIPIFFDSVEIRQVISDVESVRYSFLDIARILTGEDEDQDQEGIDA